MGRAKKYLTCTNVLYYGITDENIFFEWIKRINCIENFDGQLNDLYLYLKYNELSEDDLYEFLSLFKRYNIDMKQLRNFLTDENKGLFLKDKTAYWYESLFGDS